MSLSSGGGGTQADPASDRPRRKHNSLLPTCRAATAAARRSKAGCCGSASRARDIHVIRKRRGSALGLGDFTGEKRLIAAANAILDKRQPQAGRIPCLPADGGSRIDRLESAFAALAGIRLPKTGLSYELPTFFEAHPHAGLLDRRCSPGASTRMADLGSPVSARDGRADLQASSSLASQACTKSPAIREVDVTAALAPRSHASTPPCDHRCR